MMFKVWDKLKSKWSTRSFFTGKDGKLYVWGKVSKSFYESKPRYVPVYSTGKIDKNGAEAYNKDIIKILGNRNIHGYCVGDIMEIYWSESGFFPLCESGDYGCSRLTSSDFKIIGNKFENPELMEPK